MYYVMRYISINCYYYYYHIRIRQRTSHHTSEALFILFMTYTKVLYK